MELNKQRWRDLSYKDKATYVVAYILIGSGILMAFLSFFLNAFNIATGVLLYIAQAFIIGGGLMGAGLYFKSQWIELNTGIKQEIDKKIEELKHGVNTEKIEDEA